MRIATLGGEERSELGAQSGNKHGRGRTFNEFHRQSKVFELMSFTLRGKRGSGMRTNWD